LLDQFNSSSGLPDKTLALLLLGHQLYPKAKGQFLIGLMMMPILCIQIFYCKNSSVFVITQLLLVYAKK
jgi:hypothetical protein